MHICLKNNPAKFNSVIILIPFETSEILLKRLALTEWTGRTRTTRWVAIWDQFLIQKLTIASLVLVSECLGLMHFSYPTADAKTLRSDAGRWLPTRSVYNGDHVLNFIATVIRATWSKNYWIRIRYVHSNDSDKAWRFLYGGAAFMANRHICITVYTVWVKKKSPPKVFWHFSPTLGKF